MKTSDKSVFQRIVEDYGEEIELIKNFKKGEQSVPLSLRVRARDKDTVHKIAFNSPEFSTDSDCWRAVIHIGTAILWHRVKGGVRDRRTHILMTMMEQNKKMLAEVETAQEIEEHIVELVKEKHSKGLTEKEFKECLDRIFRDIPEEIESRLNNNFKRSKDGYELKELIKEVRQPATVTNINNGEWQ